MLKINMSDIHGFVMAMYGMREPFKQTYKCDSRFNNRFEEVGPEDLKLAKKLALAGPTHAKYRRMIQVWAEVTAPLYWWKQLDTYKIGTVDNSESTMHTAAAKEFTISDFACEDLYSFTNQLKDVKEKLSDLTNWYDEDFRKTINDSPIIVAADNMLFSPFGLLESAIIPMLNKCRDIYLKTKDKAYWRQIIQLLPDSYIQTRMLNLNYEVLAKIYRERRDHKLGEWHTFCDWIEPLPHAEEMIFPEKENNDPREKVSDLLGKLYFNSGTNLDMTGVVANQYYCEEIWKTLYGEDAEVPAWMRLWKGGPEE